MRLVALVIVIPLAIGAALWWYFEVHRSAVYTRAIVPLWEDVDVETPVTLQTKVLATVPPDVEMRWFWFSSDGKQVAYLGQRSGKEFININGVEGPQYDFLAGSDPNPEFSFYFSQDGTSYISKAERDGKWYMIINGQEEGPYGGVDSPGLSADGKQWSYRAYRDRGSFTVLNGREVDLKGYDSMSVPHFSPDGSKIVYRAYRDGQEFVVLNGKEIAGPFKSNYPEPRSGGHWFYVAVLSELWSPRGNRFALTVAEDLKGVFVTIDDKKEGPYDNVQFKKFSPDGKRFGYIAEDGGKAYVVVDGKKMSQGYDDLCCLTFSNEGTEVAYVVRQGPWDAAKRWVVWGAKESRVYTDLNIHSLTFKPDDSDLVFMAEDKSREQFLVTDFGKKTGEKYMGISDIVFSPDGKRLAYKAWLGLEGEEGMKAVVLDGQRGKKYHAIRSLTFSADGKHLAYTARRNNEVFVVLDDRELESHDRLPTRYGEDYELDDSLPHLRFTPDGRYLVHGAKKGADLLWVVTEVGAPH